ncbi:MAG: NAD(P) transhydrogenase subunit alpha [Treponema sp.]|nr:NAD(P) transhydrogenase subunit alpha [Treponema sp.]
MNHLILLAVFVVSSLIGYKLIKNIPSLLHTPLMSGTNAISGITVIGAIMAAMGHTGNKILAVLAILLAVINVAAGFLVTNRMLDMFGGKSGGGSGQTGTDAQ